MKLDSVVPWGRSFDEYRRMFKLDTLDLGKSILGCADGPASFNAECTTKGSKVISVDPIYQFSCEEISQRIAKAFPKIMREVRDNREGFIWKEFDNEEHLGRVRKLAMDKFLADYNKGIADGRYIGASLPFLPFEPKQFQLALCSHFLFLYSEQIEEAAHIKAVNELCRVAEEVRIYPLVDLDANISAHLPAVLKAMENYGIECRLEPVEYQFQNNAKYMLVLARSL